MAAIDKVKVIVVGDSGVGKTSLVHLVCHSEPISNPSWTVGCGVDVKLHEYEEGTPKQRSYFVELWDVGGSSSHRNARHVFYSSVHGIILVHDLTNRKSHQNLQKWLAEVLNREEGTKKEDFDPEHFVGATQVKMPSIPVLHKGPFALDLEKSVRYVIYAFKGMCCGVVVASLVVMILLEASIMSDDTTAEEITSMNRQLLMALCVCGFALAYFFLCSYLDKGVEERNRSWIFPWFMVTTVVGLSLTVVLIISFTIGLGMIQLILPFIIMLVFYCNLLVYSFYIDLGTNFAPELPTQVVPS
ncbi:rab-like protein 3 [Macrosteles quadrilineatus]|uniref:rab-like protein 3 n=1 Tax=Macrosteles quadrilineatus TaxID=74068 RepID=UPI0023E2055E|nr:rab-like protein 3 [Macrosteles quadrilineatus]